MKRLYNSNTGRVARPRIKNRPIGVMSKEMRAELRKMSLQDKLAASMVLVGLGINFVK